MHHVTASPLHTVPCSSQNGDVCGVTYPRLTIHARGIRVKGGLHEVPCYRAFDRGRHCFWKYQDCTRSTILIFPETIQAPHLCHLADLSDVE